MNELDQLVNEKLIPFRERLIGVFQQKHPHLISILQAVLAERENKVGMQITEGGKVAGEYTLRLSGIKITGSESGKLESEVHHPFLGLMRPYVIVEKADLEKMIEDEAAFAADFAAATAKYLPAMTFKFLR